MQLINALVNPLRNALNSWSDNIQPCLSPIETLNQSVRGLFTRTEHLTSAYNACKVFRKSPLIYTI